MEGGSSAAAATQIHSQRILYAIHVDGGVSPDGSTSAIVRKSRISKCPGGLVDDAHVIQWFKQYYRVARHEIGQRIKTTKDCDPTTFDLLQEVQHAIDMDRRAMRAMTKATPTNRNTGMNLNSGRRVVASVLGSTKSLVRRCGIVMTASVPALAAVACVPSGHLTREQAPVPTFDPIAFFAGPTQGHGSLVVAFSGSKPTLVEGHGVIEADGSVRLEQTVRIGDKAATRRTWHLHRVAAGHYAGTLSDARGPVAGIVTGNLLRLSFAMKGGLHAEQFLYLQPGGQVALNRMVVKKIGIPVASLDETIFRRPS